MSDEEEENSAEEQEEEEDEEEEEQEDGSGDDDEQEQDEDDDEDDEQEGSNDDQEEEEEDQGGSGQEEQESKDQPPEKLPKFRSIEPEEFKFTSLLSEISSLSMSVDHFINTLPSHGGSSSSSYYRSSYVPPPRPPEVPLVLPREEPRVVVMKDEDTQVSMQPQIVIQPTRVEKPVEPVYKISNESNKFLAQLYEENKKLKRWQNSSHSLNNHSAASAFYGSRERFERQQYEKGLFNVDERNREIDQAIEMLKRENDS